ncbi:MAG: putative Ig domain-containing protein [bacterium]
MKRLVSPLTALALVPLLLLSCNLFDSSKKVTFQPQNDLYISYGTMGTNVDAVTLLAAGGEPLNGYTWTLSGGSFPSGTTVDPLTGVFKATGGAASHTGGTFTMTATAGSYSGSKKYTVRAVNYGSGPVPAAIFQQYDQYGVDPSALILPDAAAGKRYGASLFVLGGTPPYYWSEDLTYAGRTDLSSVGLTIHRTNGVVTGTPPTSASGKTVRFRYIVTDSEGETAIFEPVYTINIR